MKKIEKKLTASFLAVQLFAVPLYTETAFNLQKPLTGAAGFVGATDESRAENEVRYSLSSWISESAMGNEAEVLHRGIPYYYCYTVTDKTTGTYAETTSTEFKFEIVAPDGTVTNTVTFTSADISDGSNPFGYYQIPFQADAVGDWKINFQASGDISGKLSKTFTVTAPRVKLQTWFAPDGNSPYPGSDSIPEMECETKTCLRYLLTDIDTGKRLDNRVTGYQLKSTVWDPGNVQRLEYTYDAEDFANGFLCRSCTWKDTAELGVYHGSITLTGDIEVVEAESSPDAYFKLIKATPFRWGVDNWICNNDQEFFVDNYYVDPKYLEKMIEGFGLSNVDAEYMRRVSVENNEGTFGGVCYGITMSEMLARKKILNLADYGGQSVVSENTNTPEMRSLLVFLYDMQNTAVGSQYKIRTSSSVYGVPNQADAVKKTVAALNEKGGLYNVCISLYDKKNSTSTKAKYAGHSILAYGVENANYTSAVTGLKYDKRILIADPNYLGKNELYGDACIYYNSSDYSWMIPAYNNSTYSCYWNSASGSQHPYGYIKCALTYDSATDYEDILSADKGKDTYFSTEIWECSNAAALDCSIVSKSTSGVSSHTLSGSSGNSDDFGIGAADSPRYYYYAAESKYPAIMYREIKTKTVPLDYRMRSFYHNVGFFADLANVVDMKYSPDGTISLEGENLAYDVAVVTNEGKCPTKDWSKIEISNSVYTGTSKMECSITENGYILKSDNLSDISVETYGKDNGAAVIISTEYPEVYIYEVNKNTIGVKVDTNQDGIYETSLNVQPAVYQDGDVNGDGAADAMDSAEILVESARLGAGETGSFTPEQNAAADIDENGKVDSTDAARILVYAAAVGAGDEDAQLKS